MGFSWLSVGWGLVPVAFICALAWAVSAGPGRRRAASFRSALWRAALGACVVGTFGGAVLLGMGIQRPRVTVPLARTMIRVAQAIRPAEAAAPLLTPPFTTDGAEGDQAPGARAVGTASTHQAIRVALVTPTTPATVPVARLRGRTLDDESAAAWAEAEAGVRPYVLAVALLYGAGVCVFALSLLRDVVRVWAAVRRARPCGDEGVLSALRDAASGVSLSRPCRVLYSADATVPVVLGGPRPVLVLPDGFTTDDDAAEAVLAHEVAHIRRWDPEVNALARLFRVLNWDNPFAWLLERQIRLAAEEVADDSALTTFPDAPSYARHLYAYAKAARGPGATAVSYRGGVLAERVHRILREGADRALGIPRKALTCIALSAAVLGVVFGAVNVQAQVWWSGAVDDLPRDPLKRAIILLQTNPSSARTAAAVRILRRLGDEGLAAYPQLDLVPRGWDETQSASSVPPPYDQLVRPPSTRVSKAVEDQRYRMSASMRERVGRNPDVDQDTLRAAIQVPLDWMWDPDPRIRCYALLWAERTPKALDGEVSVLRTDPEDKVRLDAVTWLAKWPSQAGDVLTALLATVQDDQQSTIVRSAAAFALAQQAHRWRTHEQSGDADWRNEDTAYRRLVSEGMPPLDAILRDPDQSPELRVAVAEAVAELGQRLPGELVPLIEGFIDAPPSYTVVEPWWGYWATGLRTLGACEADREEIATYILQTLARHPRDDQYGGPATAGLERLGEPYDRVAAAMRKALEFTEKHDVWLHAIQSLRDNPDVGGWALDVLATSDNALVSDLARRALSGEALE